MSVIRSPSICYVRVHSSFTLNILPTCLFLVHPQKCVLPTCLFSVHPQYVLRSCLPHVLIATHVRSGEVQDSLTFGIMGIVNALLQARYRIVLHYNLRIVTNNGYVH